MADEVCDELIYERPWVKYTEVADEIPHEKGIYVIGVKIKGKRDIQYLYLGRSKDVHNRLEQRKNGRQEIGKFVKYHFKKNGGIDLRVKWIKEPKPKKKETPYINCVEQKLGSKLEYNIIGRGK